MPTLQPVGRRSDPTAADADPVTIPIVGYDADLEEVIQEIRFRAMSLTGVTVRSTALIHQIEQIEDEEQQKAMYGMGVMEFLHEVVLPADARAFADFLDQPGVNVEMETLVAVYTALLEYYTGRPTQQRSASHNGRVTYGPTSQAAAPSPESTSNDSQSISA